MVKSPLLLIMLLSKTAENGSSLITFDAAIAAIGEVPADKEDINVLREWLKWSPGGVSQDALSAFMSSKLTRGQLRVKWSKDESAVAGCSSVLDRNEDEQSNDDEQPGLELW